MNDYKENKGKELMKVNSSLSSAVAIVLAGGLIALAIYFGGNQSPAVLPADEGQGVVVDEGATEPKKTGVGDIREVSKEDHIRGVSNAKVTIIEYSDLECPFCKRFHPTMQKIVDEYPNDVRWVYRHFPLEMLHSKAKKEAEATECAGEQGKFWEMLDKIFVATPSNNGLNIDDLPKLAREAGVIDIKRFESCLESQKYAERVEEDLADAEAAGGRGTPYSVIIDSSGQKQPLSGAQPYESVKQAVERALLVK
jgi:protein-disulfide isomerase